ncbi:uncharacterized protein HKW66_Vig0193030 [Vigna angularis]|uniref:Uncharacterized protein n=2 Tax=Phaseolus angularis TaxID=3914 RepID=A0A8T0KQE3_PHAAN|nr:uncharacterized protein LOC108325791 [Vigna angularis]KAG2401661.1 uncharacterized protein HKW66_Vig0193030 [Vigna angularis]BAT94322.1 hypothetical protein VIGAN_08091500 [Vigna angularis var. angularis]
MQIMLDQSFLVYVLLAVIFVIFMWLTRSRVHNSFYKGDGSAQKAKGLKVHAGGIFSSFKSEGKGLQNLENAEIICRSETTNLLASLLQFIKNLARGGKYEADGKDKNK